MGSYKELLCIEVPDPIWKMDLVYCIVDTLIITEVGPLLVESLIGQSALLTHHVYTKLHSKSKLTT